MKKVNADVWVFDLDNTLYPRDCNLFAQIDVKMKAFISELLNVDVEEAHRGTTEEDQEVWFQSALAAGGRLQAVPTRRTDAGLK